MTLSVCAGGQALLGCQDQGEAELKWAGQLPSFHQSVKSVRGLWRAEEEWRLGDGERLVGQHLKKRLKNWVGRGHAECQKKPTEPTLRCASHIFAPPHSRCSEMFKLDFYLDGRPDKGPR